MRGLLICKGAGRYILLNAFIFYLYLNWGFPSCLLGFLMKSVVMWMYFQYWHTWNWLLMFGLMYSSHRKKWQKFLINWHYLLLTNNGNKIKVNLFIDLAGVRVNWILKFWSFHTLMNFLALPTSAYMKGVYLLNCLPVLQFMVFFFS